MEWADDDGDSNVVKDVIRELTVAEIESIVKGLRFANVQNPIQENIANIHQDKTRKKLATVRVKESKIPELKKRIHYHFFNSIVAPGEAVGVNAAQCIGEPTTQLTLNSVAGWESIIIRTGTAQCDVVRIGDWIDSLLFDAPSNAVTFIPANRTEYLELPSVISTPSTDSLGRVTWERITAVTRHLPVGNCRTVTTLSGRSVTVTESKSLLVWNSSLREIVEIDASAVQIGDKVPVIYSFPVGANVYNINTSAGLLRFTPAFGALIGYLISGKGVILSNSVQVQVEKRHAPGLVQWCIAHELNFGHIIGKEGDVDIIDMHRRIDNCTFTQWLRCWLQFDSEFGMRIPSDLYIANLECIRELLKVYSIHNTHVYSTEDCTFVHMTPGISEGINVLFSRFGVYCTFGAISGTVRMCTSELEHFLAPTNTEYVVNTEKFGDVHLDTIISIAETPIDGWVYDLTVEHTQNFTLANGLCVRDTFHSAGISAKNVTLGFPRATELFNATKTPANPTCTIYFKHNNSTPHSLHGVIDKIRYTIIDHLKTAIAIYSPDEHPEEYWHAVWIKLHGGKIIGANEWCLRLRLAPIELFKRGLMLADLAECIQCNFIDARCVYSPLCESTIDVFINCTDVTPADDTTDTLETARLYYMSRIVTPKIRGVYVCGIEGITEVYRRRAKCNEIFGNYALKKELQDKLKGKTEEWIIDTDGTNLAAIVALNGVDPYRTISNDLWELSRMLGIEAVRSYLFVEFMNIVSSGGTSINPVHIEMLVDKMTYTGGIRAITRFGVETSQYDPIARATFEHVMDHLNTSAIFSETDHVSGISSNVVIGKPINAGTGAVQVEKIPLQVTTITAGQK